MEQLQENVMTNPRYLLDRCLNFDWDNVEQICYFLLRIFHATSQFSIDDDLVEAAFTQLTTRDSFGNTVLHATCYHKPPAPIVQAILECCVEAESAASRPDVDTSKQFQLHLLKNNRQTTPLLVACLSAASRDVVQELLDHHDPATIGAVITEPDNSGRTTFQGLLQRYELLRKLPPFRNNDNVRNSISSGSNNKDKTRRGSKNSLNKEYQRCHEFYSSDDSSSSDDDETSSTVSSTPSSSASTKRKSASSAHDHLSVFTNSTDSTDLFHAFWDTTDMLLQGVWIKKQTDESSSTILERAANVAHCCPTKLIDMLFENQCEYEEEQESKDFTLLPLHLALTSATASESCTMHPQLAYQRQCMIERLLETNPSAARHALPTTKRTPFCEAILSGLQWHNSKSVEQLREKSTTQSSTKKQGEAADENDKVNAITGPLKSLWNHAPEMIHTIDPVTGLYPFMLAASVEYNKNNAATDNETSTNEDDFDEEEEDEDETENNEDDEGDGHDAQVVDTVYNLLRLYPQVINTTTK